MSVSSCQALLDHFRDMIASLPAVRTFLRTPNSQKPTRQAIFQRCANVEAVPVVSMTTGAAGECSFTIRGNHSRVFIPGTKNRFGDSIDRDELTTVSAVAYDDEENLTTVSVSEALSAWDDEPLTVRGQSCPRILVAADGVSIRKLTQTASDFQFDRGTLLMALEWEPGAEFYNPALHIDDPQGAGEEFGNHVDAILCQMQKVSGQDSTTSPGKTWIDFSQFDISFGPEEINRPENNDGRPKWSCIIDGLFGGVG